MPSLREPPFEMAFRREVLMAMQNEGERHGLWNNFANNSAAQMVMLVVVVAVLIALATKYIW